MAATDLTGRRLPLSGFETPGLHQSYPYVLEDGGEAYCIPETADAGGAWLHRANPARDRWEREARLLGGIAAIDSTVVRHDGRWWLFCTDRDVDPEGQLFLFHAPRLAGPWEPHRGNPVKVDVRSARPAGPPFRYDGALHRPGQDCASVYGRRIVVHRVTVLTSDEYEEERVMVVEPDPGGPYPDGLHTLASDGRVTVIDGMRHVVDPAALVTRLRAWRRARRVRAVRPPDGEWAS